MAIKKPASGGLFSCCSGPAYFPFDPNEVVIELDAPIKTKSLPEKITMIPVNSLLEIRPVKEDIAKARFRPPTDMFYDKSNGQVLIAVGLAGFEKDEVTVNVNQGILTVYGECKKPAASDKFGEALTVFNRELQFGSFLRRFQLPPNTLEDTAEAFMHDGMVEIKIKCINPGDGKNIELKGAGDVKKTEPKK